MERISLLLLMLLSACSTASPTGQVPTAHPTQANAEAPTLKPSQPSESPSPLDRAARSVESLEYVPDDTLPRATAQALLDLAQAIEPQSSTEASTIRECALRIAQSKSAAASGSLNLVVVKDGLSAVLRAVEQSTTTPSRSQEYNQALATLRKAIEALDAASDAPTLERRALTASAFRAASDALTLAHGGEPTFAEAENARQDAAPESSPEAQLEDARAEVLKLGQTRWLNAPLAAARALQALADLVATRGDQRVAEQIKVIRFNAERLRRKDTSKFGSAGWVKEALTSTLDALELLEADREKQVTPLSRAARRAVAGIVERDSLSFQRAAVQDAFRATVDAFVFSIECDQKPP